MTKTKKPRVSEDTWLKIKVKYETGKYTMQHLADEFGCAKSSISEKVKKANWQPNKTRKLLTDKAVQVSNIIEAIDITEQDQTTEPNNRTTELLSSEEIPLFKDEVLAEIGLKRVAEYMQYTVMKLVNKAAGQVTKVLDNAPDGLYIKGQSPGGTQYGRTTEFIKDLVSAMPAANTLLGYGDKLTSNVQVNGSAPIVINFNPVKKLNEQ